MNVLFVLALMVGIAAATYGGAAAPRARQPVVFAPPKPIGYGNSPVARPPFHGHYGRNRDDLACCTNFDGVLADLEDKVEDTEDDSKDLEKKVKRLSRLLYRLKKSQFNDWAAFKKSSDMLQSEPAGVPGPQGDDGETGTDGAPGAVGPVGEQGPDGEAGDNIVGLNGVDGTDGEDGERGPTGPDGEVGDVVGNTPGGPGPTGYPGPVGPAGPTGETGIEGVDGPQGPQGPQGADGAAVDCNGCQLDACAEAGCYNIYTYWQPTGFQHRRRGCWKAGCYHIHAPLTNPNGGADTDPDVE